MSAPNYPSTSGFSGSMSEQGQEDSDNLTTKAQNDLAQVGEEIKQQAANLGEEAKAQVGELAEKAKAQVGELADKAKGMANEQKQLLASQLGGISDALDKVASELETRDDTTASYVRSVAQGAERVTSMVRDRDVDEIVSMVQDFGRKQPAAFIGAAALLGFAASRFIMASAKRRSSQSTSMNEMDSSMDTQSESSSGLPSTSTGTGSIYSRPMGGTDGGI